MLHELPVWSRGLLTRPYVWTGCPRHNLPVGSRRRGAARYAAIPDRSHKGPDSAVTGIRARPRAPLKRKVRQKHHATQESLRMYVGIDTPAELTKWPLMTPAVRLGRGDANRHGVLNHRPALGVAYAKQDTDGANKRRNHEPTRLTAPASAYSRDDQTRKDHQPAIGKLKQATWPITIDPTPG